MLYAILMLTLLAEQGLDAESRKNLELVSAACDAARTAHHGYSADLKYTVESSPHVQHLNRHKSRQTAGELLWDGARVRYVWRSADAPDKVIVCVARDSRQFLRAERYDEKVLADYTTFEVRPPLAAIMTIAPDLLSIADPEMWFAGTSLGYLRNGIASKVASGVECRGVGEDFECRYALPQGRSCKILFSARAGLLPVRKEMTAKEAGTSQVSEETYAWEKVEGKWAVMKMVVIDRWIDGPTRRQSEARRVLEFSNVRTTRTLTDADFAADALPLPIGSSGIDKRVLPAIGLIRDAGGIVEQGKESAAAREARTAVLRTDDTVDADAAAAARRAYYWRLAAKICGGLAAAALLGAVAWKLRSRT